MSFSQSSQKNNSQSSQRTKDLTEEELNAAVQNVVSFLLSDMRNKRKIRKDDIVANALKKSSRQYIQIIRTANEILINTFGLMLVKVPASGEMPTGGDILTSDAFIIVNKHRTKFSELTLDQTTPTELQEDTILTVVLSSIFMNRGQMYESHVMAILETIGFLSDKFYGKYCEHKMRDYVPNLVKKTFVRQLYLDAEVVPRPQQPQNPPLPENDTKVTLYHWGCRALIEVSVDKIVDYIVKMHDGNKPAGFPTSYYKELKQKQQELQMNLSA